jgi:hypothetical protein
MTVHESVKRESLKPLSRIGPVVSSTLDLETVLTTGWLAPRSWRVPTRR